MDVRLIYIDKCLGVGPIGVGETLCRLLAKCVLGVTGKDAKLACRADQVCMGTKVGIEGAIHIAKARVDQYQLKDIWGFLLVNSRKMFNEGNRTAMMWTMRYK